MSGYNQNYQVFRQQVEFTRPSNTTAYAVGDCVSNNATTTTPMDFTGLNRYSNSSGYIVGAVLYTDQKSNVAVFRVHLYRYTATALAGDNAQWFDKYLDVDNKIGSFDLPAMTTGADTANSTCSTTKDFTIRVPFHGKATLTSIYAVLETQTIFTPASAQKFNLCLFADQA